MTARGTYAIPSDSAPRVVGIALRKLLTLLGLSLDCPLNRECRTYVVIDRTGSQTVIRAVIEPRPGRVPA